MIQGTLRIVMALYHRLERLETTIAQLQAQDDEDWTLHLVLNSANAERQALVQDQVEKEHRVRPALLRSDNIGGFARFWLVRHLWPRLSVGPLVVLFLDDDVSIRPNYLSYVRAAADPAAVYSKTVWRFRQKPRFSAEGLILDPGGSYWDRVEEDATSGDGDYAGTGWMSCPRALLLSDELVLKEWKAPGVVDNLIGVEDLWLSFVATRLGYPLRPLRKLPAEMVPDGKDTWPQIRQKKTALLHLIRTRFGWRR